MEVKYTEDSFREYLVSRGFSVNHQKDKNETGFDIVAVKDGYSFLIEFKTLEKRDNGVFRYTGDVLGDVLILGLPCGSWTVWNDGQQLITKSARFLSMLN